MRDMHPVPKIGYVGRLAEEKGVDVLLDAIKDCPQPVETFFVGNGPLAGMIDKIGKTNPHLNINHIPAVPAKDVSHILRSLDLLILPSKTTTVWAEQFGRVLIEAMSQGTVPIGSTSGAIPWVIGNAGLVFPEGNAAELARQMERVLTNADMWKDLSLKGQQRVADHFTWDRVAKQLINTYTQMKSERVNSGA